MFDITECKCKEYNECGCGQTRRIPEDLRDFISDQRTLRRLRLLHIIPLLNIQENQADDLENHLIVEHENECQSDDNTESVENDDDSVLNSDEEYLPNRSVNSAKSSKRNLLQLPKYAKVCVRHHVSDRDAAELASALFEDIGFVTEGDISLVVDKCKMQRQKNKVSHEISEEALSSIGPLQSSYFDGRDNKTLVIEKDDEDFRKRRTIK